MESGDPRVDGERVFPQILLQIVHPAFPVTRFLSFSSLYEASLNDHEPSIANDIREGCGKSKWKFKMAFAMKGGGLEGVSFAIKLF